MILKRKNGRLVGLILAAALAIGGVFATPLAASAAKPTCTPGQHFGGDKILFAADVVLCARFEGDRLYVSAVSANMTVWLPPWEASHFEGNIVITRDGATVASHAFSEPLPEWGQRIESHWDIPVVVPGLYEVHMDGHLYYMPAGATVRLPDYVATLQTIKLAVAL